MRKIIATLALIIVTLATPAYGQTRPEFPELSGRVVDTADELTAADEAQLELDLEAFEKKSGHQFVVVTIPDLQGYPQEDYAYQLGRHWGIGRKGVNDGILLLRSPGDGKPGSGRTYIAIGYGLEAVLTDGQMSAVYNQIMRPILVGDTGTEIDELPKPQRAGPAILAGAAEIMRIGAITPEQRAQDERRLAAEHARARAAFMDGLATFFGWVLGLAVIGSAGFWIWWKATAQKRAERKRIEAERAAERARKYAEAQRQREIDNARRAEEARQRRLEAARAREAMLAGMSPGDRQAFLINERRQAEEAQRRRAAEEARRQEEQKRLRQIQEADEARRRKRRRQEDASSGGFGGFGGGSFGGGSGGGFSGGGGSFGGGGAGGSD